MRSQLLFQLQFGMSPLKSGLLIAPMALGAITMRAISSKFIKMYGFKKVIFTAPFGIFSALILIAFISKESSYLYICCACALLGFFNILLMSSNGPMIYTDIPKLQSANATSMDITIRQFFASLSVSLGSFLLIFFLGSLNTTIDSSNGINAFKYTFFILAGIILLQIIVSFGLKKEDGLEASRGAS